MKAKIICILVVTLMIATALPAVGTMNGIKERENGYTFIKNQEVDEENVQPLHDPEVEWERFYGGPNDDLFRNIKQTNDGGYIAVGVWNGESHWLVRLDANGDEVWNVTALPDPGRWPRCYVVEKTSDGGFITAGCHELGWFGYNRCIWKVDGNGDTEWCKIYDDPLLGFHSCIQETNDGGYIICGEIEPDPENQYNFDVLLFKTDSAGNIEWQKIWSYGEEGSNAWAVRQTPDGGYILSGRKGITHVEADFLIIKTDSNGNMEWEKTYGGYRWEQSYCNDILFTDDGGYLFLADTQSYGAGKLDIWLIKTDSQGNMEWNRTFGGKSSDVGSGLVFEGNGIMFSATQDLNGMMSPKGEGLVIKTDINGNIEWQHTFGYENEDQFQSVILTSDGGYIFAGNTDSTIAHGAGEFDGWIIKMKAFENQRPNTPDKPTGKTEGKPGENITFTTSGSDPDDDDVLFMWDWGDGNFSDWKRTTEVSYAWEEYGEYYIKIIAKDEHDAVSDWSEALKVSMPRLRAENRLFVNFLQNYLEIFPLLKILMQRLGLRL